MQSPWQKKPQQHPKIKNIVTIAGNSLMWNDDKTLQVIVENSFALMMGIIYEKKNYAQDLLLINYTKTIKKCSEWWRRTLSPGIHVVKQNGWAHTKIKMWVQRLKNLYVIHRIIVLHLQAQLIASFSYLILLKKTNNPDPKSGTATRTYWCSTTLWGRETL